MLSPDSMLVITAAVCVLVIGVYALAESSQRDLERFQDACTQDLTYAQAMAFLEVPEDYPPGMLSGLWGEDPGADAWWWRCSLCREYDLHLSAVAAALEASTHVCDPAYLERAKADAKAQHPAFRPAPEPRLPDPWGDR